MQVSLDLYGYVYQFHDNSYLQQELLFFKSITDNIEKELEEHGIFVRAKEGTSSSNWILLDYGDYIIHVFKTEDRQFYNLERLWKDAQEITVEAI